MPLEYHGYEIDAGGGSGRLKFGFLRFLQRIFGAYCMPMIPGSSAPQTWGTRWMDALFQKGVKKLQDSIWKIHLCAEVVAGDAPILVTGLANGCTEEQIANFQRAHEDVPIHLDSIVFYLKISADCLSKVVANLYGEKGRTRLPRHSFRQMRRWFLETRPSFDPAFRDLLQNRTGWFDRLARDEVPRGLREVITHYGGTQQIIVLREQPETISAVRSMLVGDTRIHCQDLIGELTQCMRGFCEFLDACLLHFCEVVLAQLEDSPPAADWLSTQNTTFYSFDGGLPPAAWLFPHLG